MWLARDKNKELYIYKTKPIKISDKYFISKEGDKRYVDKGPFSEVTFENSPVEIELKIKK